MGVLKQQAMSSGRLTSKQENSYNRFFVNAFTDADIDEIIESGGATSKENFISKAKDNIKDPDYWNALFKKGDRDRTFKGRDGKVRKSKFQASYGTLGEAIYNNYFASLGDARVKLTEYKRTGKTKTFFVVRKTVSKGERISFGGKLYKGGMFLPKAFKIRK